MEDTRTMQNLINELSNIERNNQNNLEHITSIDLLLVSNNNGTVKDAEISKKISNLKEKIREVSEVSNQLTSLLNQHK